MESGDFFHRPQEAVYFSCCSLYFVELDTFTLKMSYSYINLVLMMKFGIKYKTLVTSVCRLVAAKACLLLCLNRFLPPAAAPQHMY